MRRAKAASVIRRQSKISRTAAGAEAGAVAPAHVRTPQRGQERRSGATGGKGGWVRHARYLAREHAQQRTGARPGLRCASARDSIWSAVVREWERGDELMWSLIISPEDAERIDLRQHARDLVAGMERDLGTQLEWVAIDHHNTDDAHIHLLIRGVRDDGQSSDARSRLHECAAFGN